MTLYPVVSKKVDKNISYNNVISYKLRYYLHLMIDVAPL